MVPLVSFVLAAAITVSDPEMCLVPSEPAAPIEQPAKQVAKAEQANRAYDQHDPWQPFWNGLEAVSAALTALFSGVLIWATREANKTSRSALGQSRRANEVATKAAKAAELSAKAAIASERAYLFFDVERFVWQTDVLEHGTVILGPGGHYVRSLVRNQGRTPAVVTETRTGMGYSANGDPADIRLTSFGDRGVVIGPKKTRRRQMRAAISEGDWKDLRSAKGMLLVVVQYEYRDIVGGETHKAGICCQVDFFEFTQTHKVEISRVGDDRWNYST